MSTVNVVGRVVNGHATPVHEFVLSVLMHTCVEKEKISKKCERNDRKTR